MTEQSTIERPKKKYQWTPERRAAAKAMWAAKREAKAAKTTESPADVPQADTTSQKPRTAAGRVDPFKAQVEADCRAAFAILHQQVGNAQIGTDEKTELPILKMYPMDQFKIEKAEGGLTRAKWRCGWNEVDDPCAVAKPVFDAFEWAVPPDSIEVLRAYREGVARSIVEFELFWDRK